MDFTDFVLSAIAYLSFKNGPCMHIPYYFFKHQDDSFGEFKKWEKFEPLSHKKMCYDLKMLLIITAIYRENTIFFSLFENSFFKDN